MGDFVNAPGLDCNVYEPYLKWNWICVATMYICWFLFFAFVMVTYMKNHNITSLHKLFLERENNIHLRLTFRFASVVAPLKVLEGILRFTTGAVVGDDVLLTVVFSATGWFLWTQIHPLGVLEWANILIVQAKFSGKDGQTMKTAMVLFKKRLRVFRVIATFSNLLPFAFLLIRKVDEESVNLQKYSLQMYLASLFFVSHCIAFVFLHTLGALPVLTAIERLIAKNLEATKSEKLEAKLVKLRIFLRLARISNRISVIACALFCAPVATKFSSYLIAAAWTCSPINSMGILWMIMNVKNEKKKKKKNIEIEIEIEVTEKKNRTALV